MPDAETLGLNALARTLPACPGHEGTLEMECGCDAAGFMSLFFVGGTVIKKHINWNWLAPELLERRNNLPGG